MGEYGKSARADTAKSPIGESRNKEMICKRKTEGGKWNAGGNAMTGCGSSHP